RRRRPTSAGARAGDDRRPPALGPERRPVRRDRTGLPRLSRLARHVDEARLAEGLGLELAPRARSAAPARRACAERRDRAPEELLQAAAGVCLSPYSVEWPARPRPALEWRTTPRRRRSSSAEARLASR